MTRRTDALAAQPMPTPAEALEAYAAGKASRPGAGNPYAGRRVLGSVWALGNRDRARELYAQRQQTNA